MKFFALIALVGAIKLDGVDKVKTPKGPDGVQNDFGYHPTDDDKYGGPLHD